MTGDAQRKGTGRPSPSDEELLAAIPRGRVGKELQVGAFVLVGFVAVLASLFLLTDPSTFRGRYHVTTVVEDAGGLRRGDPVQMKGVNIGTVQGFQLVPEGVEITLEVEREWKIPSDSRTRLVSAGLLGGRTVTIVPGRSGTPLRDGDRLPGHNVEGLLEAGNELGEEAQAVLARIQEILSEPTVGALQSSALQLDRLLRTLAAAAEAQSTELARLTASLNRSATGLEDAAGAGDDFARAVARADSALARVNETTMALQGAALSLQRILERVEAGEGTLGQLATDDSLYRALTLAMESLNLLLTDVRENPGRYVKIEIF